MTRHHDIPCPFCNGQASFVYTMDTYGIYQCRTCGTGQASPMPDEAALKNFYNNFRPNLSLNNLTRLLDSAHRMFRESSLPQGKNLKMLDIGGGGGYCCKAFELLDYGESYYVDLDPYSCEFAKNKLKLERVYNCDALELAEKIDTKFDFIHCRHLIEHLIDPANFLIKTMSLLSKNGLFVMVCPNGASREYLAYLKDTRMKNRIDLISSSNSWSKLKTWLTLFRGAMNHGIDPPRHLWAITPDGVQRLMESYGFKCATATRLITDQTHSIFYKPDKNFSSRIQRLIARKFFAPRRGACHLVTTIQHADNY